MPNHIYSDEAVLLTIHFLKGNHPTKSFPDIFHQGIMHARELKETYPDLGGEI